MRDTPALLAILALLVQAAPALAQVPVATPAAPLRTEARMALQVESLSNNADDWHDASLEITSDAGMRRKWYATLHEVSRFSLRDELFGGGYVHPLGKNAVVSIEAQGSFSHQVVPQFGLAGRIDASVGRGWVLNGGVAGRRYDNGAVTLLTGGIEKYTGSFRLAYTAFGAVLDGDRSLSHAVTVDRTYGSAEDNVVGITLSGGEELEQDVRAELRASQIRAISARGRHWLGRRIGLLYTIGVHEQGTHYTRRGGSAGIAFRF